MARTQGSHSDITGPRIRAAALRLFAERGYAAVSMRQIASDVGVQAGALYNYTPDKQSLLFELMRTHMEELLAATPAQEGPPEAQLETFVRFHLGFHKDRGAEIFIAYNELRSLTPENFKRIETLRRSYEGVLERILAEGAAAGVMQVPEPKVAARAIIALLTGIYTWYREDGRLSLEDLQGLYWGMVRGLVAMH